MRSLIGTEQYDRVELDSAKQNEDIRIYKPQASFFPQSRVHFSILSARDLPLQTGHFCFAQRPMNSFAVFTFQSIFAKTSVERRTSSPVWNMPLVDLGVIDHDSEDFLKLEIFDRVRHGKKVLLGSVLIPSVRFLKSGEGNHQRWLKVYKEGKHRNQKNAVGELLIKFRNDRVLWFLSFQLLVNSPIVTSLGGLWIKHFTLFLKLRFH